MGGGSKRMPDIDLACARGVTDRIGVHGRSLGEDAKIAGSIWAGRFSAEIRSAAAGHLALFPGSFGLAIHRPAANTDPLAKLRNEPAPHDAGTKPH